MATNKPVPSLIRCTQTLISEAYLLIMRKIPQKEMGDSD
jgi:hypothetical protein